jgi:hypothetical protein
MLLLGMFLIVVAISIINLTIRSGLWSESVDEAECVEPRTSCDSVRELITQSHSKEYFISMNYRSLVKP